MRRAEGRRGPLRLLLGEVVPILGTGSNENARRSLLTASRRAGRDQPKSVQPRRPHAGLDLPWLDHNLRGRRTETNEQKHKGKMQINAFCGFRFSIYETHGECFNFHNGST